MPLLENHFYHYYNQGNNRGKIFYSRENYLFFLKHFQRFVSPNCKVIAYCLMPNHFHFQIFTTQYSVVERKIGGLMVPALNNGFRNLLSSYSQAINKQENRTGSLFRQHTKAKLLDVYDQNYPLTCFHYLHQNPIKTGLVHKMEDWEFSSFQDYMGVRKDSLCDQNLALELLDLSKETIYQDSYRMIPKENDDCLY